MKCLFKSLFIVILIAAGVTVASATPCSTAQREFIYVMFPSAAGSFVRKVCKSDGTFVTYNVTGKRGMGVAVVGNIMYYTNSNSNSVYRYDLRPPGMDLGAAFTVPQASNGPTDGLGPLAYDGTNLWIGDFNASNQVFVYDISKPSPSFVKTVHLSSCFNILIGNSHGNYYCDGLEYFLDPNNFNQPSLVGNGQFSLDAFSYPINYFKYSQTGLTGTLPGPVFFTIPASNGSPLSASGIAWDGTHFYTAEFDGINTHSAIQERDSFGAKTALRISLSKGPSDHLPFPEDLSVHYDACVDPPNTSMVAWYPFDETTGTSSANLASGNTGFWKWISSPPVPVPGRVREALSFNGVDQYLESIDSIATNFGPASTSASCTGSGGYSTCPGDFSIDMWIQVPPYAPSSMVMLDKRGLSGYALFLSAGSIGLQLVDGLPPSPGFANYLSTALTLNDNSWHHIAVTIQRSGNAPAIIFYHNGASLNKVATTRLGSLVSNGTALRIGTGYPYAQPTGWFQGALDELEIHNRVVTAKEIRSIFDAGSDGKCKPW